MSHRTMKTVNLITAIVDIILIFVAFGLAYEIRYRFQWFRDIDPAFYTTFQPYIPLAILLAGLILVAFLLEGVYRPSRSRTFGDEIYAVINGTTTGFVVMVFIVFFWRPLVYSRLIFVYATALIIVLLILARVIRRMLLGYLRSRGIGVDRVLIVGSGSVGLSVIRNLVARPELGYKVVGVLDDDPERGSKDIGRIPALGSIENFAEVLQQQQADEVIIAIPWRFRTKILDLVSQSTRAGVRPRVVPDLFQMSLSSVQLQDVAGIPMMSPSEAQLGSGARASKRLIDMIGSGIGLIILSPILLIIGTIIRLDSPGSPIFRQPRIGRNGKGFEVYKFRTMVQDADQKKDAIRHLNEADGPLFKIKDDPRVTRAGSFLRRSSLDELPQLWNVLRGDMSLVGPRPALPEEVEGYADWHRTRLATAPGITGLWQISGRSDIPFDEMVLLDIYYIENWSPLLDLSIMFRTIPKVLAGSGAY
ncbi:MAG: sugar transferase [Chloroflexota bacterium]|nr:sugar transferase [Chloroflexota bacterium]